MMQDMQNEASGSGDHVDLVEYVMILARHWKWLMVSALGSGIVAIAVALLLPPWYRSTAAIMPPKEPFSLASFSGGASLLRNFSPFGKIGGGGSQGTYNFLAILESRTVKEEVVRRNDLMAVYEIADSSMEKAIEVLESHVAVTAEDEDYLTITVEDRSANRAAEIANCYVDLLNERSIALGSLEAKRNREFIATRLEETRTALRKAEDSLRIQQESSDVPYLPDAGMTAIADLFAEKAKKEIELAIVSQSTDPDNPVVRQLKVQVQELTRKTRSIPESGMEGLRRSREVAIQQKILEFIVPLHEQAKVEEKRDMPVVVVLDRAVPAERKHRPKRAMIVAGSVVVTFLLSLSFVLLHEVLQRRGVYERIATELTSRRRTTGRA